MTDNIKLPPMPATANFYGMYGEYTKSQVEALMREAVRLNAQAVPDIEDLKDRLVAISSAVADSDHREAQAIIGTTLQLLSAAPQPAPQPAQPLTDEQRKFLLFLDGSGEWDGVWFGDPHPTKTGAYWWRKDMHDVFHGIGVKP